MTDRHDLERALRQSGQTSVPGPDPEFVDLLERRLLAARTTVVPLAPRRSRRTSVATVAAVTLALGGAAATAAVIVHQTTKDDTPPAEEVTTVATTIGEATTVALVTGSSTPTPSVEVTAPGLGDPGTTTADAATSTPGTTSPTSVGTVATTPATPPPSSSSSTTTTEVHVPASMTLSCSADGSAIHCSWSPGPSGLARYAVLRGDGTVGRVFFVAAGTTSWTDPSAVPGVAYTYVVHAFDPNDKSLGHTPLVPVTCC